MQRSVVPYVVYMYCCVYTRINYRKSGIALVPQILVRTHAMRKLCVPIG